MSEAWVVLAQMLRPQGRKGELLAELLTDFPERLVEKERLYLAKEGFAGSEHEAQPCRVKASWLPKGKNEGRVVLEIAGIDSIEAAERLAGYELLIQESDRAPLEDGAAYISDLVGCSVMDGETMAGTVREVQFPTSADGRRRLDDASPLLVVELPDGRGEAMIPFVQAFLRSVDVKEKILRMELPKGLLELSAEGAADGNG